MWPDSGTVRVADVAALADRWQRRWPSARHASPAASLTVANMRHLLLDALWKQLPTATAAQQRERAVRLSRLALCKPQQQQMRCSLASDRRMYLNLLVGLKRSSQALTAGLLGSSLADFL